MACETAIPCATHHGEQQAEETLGSLKDYDAPAQKIYKTKSNQSNDSARHLTREMDVPPGAACERRNTHMGLTTPQQSLNLTGRSWAEGGLRVAGPAPLWALGHLVPGQHCTSSGKM